MAENTQYTEDNIRSLDWKEHIRMRPGMYIGKLGDGSSADDGIYILLKEVIDNSIDEFVMGSGKTIEVSIQGERVTVRDYGRGIPLGKVVDVVSKMNTGGKYDSRAFKKSVGLNGVGTKAVNALSNYFRVESTREGKSASAEFSRGELGDQEFLEETSRRKGTKISFVPDSEIFKNFKYRSEYVARMLKNYVYLNPGLTIMFNGEKFFSENGLKDLLSENIQESDRLYPTEMGGELPTVRTFINDFLKTRLDNYLHKNADVAELLQKKIVQAERERKELSGIRKLARDRAKKASLHNKKLRDCRVHLTDSKKENNLESTLFITEGDSASGSITKSRNVNTQAVFSLRGKPLNSYNMSKKIVYENEEFNLLQAALNIEDSMEDLRYNKIVIATDADVDGMHIRLLLITFFLQFFPELIKKGHIYILQTPLFRVRNKKETRYCYTPEERKEALAALGKNPEITRFKGLGEISPDEFVHFIGEDMRLDPLMLDDNLSIEELLKFYMGKNTPDRQEFIINNLKVELDTIEEEQKTVLEVE